jgi:LPXTG-site transpeptidase (sortase) family protein
MSLFLIGAIGIVNFPRETNSQVAKEAIQSIEAPKSAVVNSRVSAEELQILYHDPFRPVRVSVPRLGMDALVVPVGMDELRSVEVPVDIDIVGWYELGVRPHQELGSVALVGHRDGSGGADGVFRRIGELKEGDLVSVTNRDGSENTYEVAKVELMSKEQFPAEAPRLFAKSGPARLTLISCGGSYDRARGGYQSNIVVTTTPIT